ncbi:hypothetical protein [Aquibacillus kalidii]|uniref:hypothetical protein n=1 Tax=Aquibacillus kalidii TaxID=2762597 RepID=UPI001646D85F|nr:hypothetical protein [Aquibacillus kalidii]
MKTLFSMLILVLLFAFVGFIESQNNTEEMIGAYSSALDESETVSTHERKVPSYTELDLILEGKEEVDGQIVETYQEYEIYKDDQGNIVKKVPTANYSYISYNAQ